MAEKEIRLPKWDGKEYYPATTTEAVADRERQKGLNEVLSDLEDTIDSYDRANQIMLNQKQDKLSYYTENTSTDMAVMKVSHVTDEATLHEDKVEVGTDNCVLLKSEDLILGADSYIKVSPEKVSMSSPEGKIEDVVGTVVSNANAIATLNGTGEGSVSKTVTDKIAEVVAGAPTDFDTLKEIADYIASDKTNAAEINNTLSRHTSEITSLQSTKQDALANYIEEPDGKTTIKYPNGTARVDVSDVRAALWANDNKTAISADANGTRMHYQKTAEDGSIEHRDEISIGKHTESSATHITLTSKSTTEEDGVKSTSTSTIQVNPDGISMSSPSGEIDDVVKEITDKVPKSGYAPDLKVNFAKELVGRGEATPEVIGSIRPTGEISIGDGNATIERIKGESVVWNQYASDDLSSYILLRGSNQTYVDGVLTATSTTANNTSYIYKNASEIIPSRLGRVIYGCAEIKADSTNAEVIMLGIGIHAKPATGEWQKIEIFGKVTVWSGAVIGVGVRVKDELVTWSVRNLKYYDLTQMFGAGNEPTTIEEFEARKPLGVSNEYNEGTIISYDGDALKSVGFNAWDEEWVNGYYTKNGFTADTNYVAMKNPIKVIAGQKYYFSNKVGYSAVFLLAHYDKYNNYIDVPNVDTGGRVTLHNRSEYVIPDGVHYIRCFVSAAYGTTYNHDICINLSHSEYRNGGYAPYEADVHPLPNITSILDADGNQLFPNGLLSAGSVHDEITATKAIQRVGVVDMGTLGWGRFAEADIYVFQVTPTDIGVYSNTTSVPNLLNKAYPSVIRADIKARDKCISQNNGGKALVIRDDAYTDATTFKQAMSGVLLYYELAEPIEVDLPEPLNMTYDAWDFGTEELVHDTPTTPLNADIVYQFNAVDRIRENSSAIEDLKGHVEERKDDGIELLTNGNLKLTLKGETREFMPATPSGDPMHYAYVSAGAEYNGSGVDIVKDAPWAALADTDEEKKVIHKAGCWYLNGVGDMTNDDIRYSYTNRTLLYSLNKRAGFANNTIIRTIYPAHSGASTSAFGPARPSILFGCNKLETLLLSDMTVIRKETDYSLSLSGSYEFHGCTALKAIGQVTPTNVEANRFIGCTSLRYIWVYALKVSINLKDSSLISKLSVKYMIDNAAPTTAISITLHHDAYARLVDDADIVAALEAKNIALEGTGGSISLVSA